MSYNVRRNGWHHMVSVAPMLCPSHRSPTPFSTLHPFSNPSPLALWPWPWNFEGPWLIRRPHHRQLKLNYVWWQSFECNAKTYKALSYLTCYYYYYYGPFYTTIIINQNCKIEASWFLGLMLEPTFLRWLIWCPNHVDYGMILIACHVKNCVDLFIDSRFLDFFMSHTLV